jgi:hypothetical protein
MHGGCSTGPRTPEGIERIRVARTIHGGRSAEMIKLQKVMTSLRTNAKALREKF